MTIGGKSYTGYKAENGGYVIPGAAVTGDIVITAQKTKINSGGGSSSGGSGGGSSAKYVSVSFIGSGADDAPRGLVGAPFVNRYEHDGDYSWNGNNYIDSDTCRIAPRE